MYAAILFAAAAALLIAWHRSRFRGLLLIALAAALFGWSRATPIEPEAHAIESDYFIPWDPARSMSLAAAVLLLCGAWSLLRGLRTTTTESGIRHASAAGFKTFAHVALRLLVTLLSNIVIFVFASMALSAGDSMPELGTHLVAETVLLIIWSLWPLIEHSEPFPYSRWKSTN